MLQFEIQIWMFRWDSSRNFLLLLEGNKIYSCPLINCIMLLWDHYAKSSLKENSRIYNGFKYCNPFFVALVPPEKNPTPREAGQQHGAGQGYGWKGRKVQDTHCERVTQLIGQHTWHITSNSQITMMSWRDTSRTLKDEDSTRQQPIQLSLFFILQSTISSTGDHPLKSILR